MSEGEPEKIDNDNPMDSRKRGHYQYSFRLSQLNGISLMLGPMHYLKEDIIPIGMGPTIKGHFTVTGSTPPRSD